MREARTIADLMALYADLAVVPILDGNKVYLAMPLTNDWEPDTLERVLAEIRQQSVIPSDPETVQFQRAAHNAIIDLVHNPQFWRVTSVADQMTRFYGYDGGSMPPMFMRGEGRNPSVQWRMTGLTKKANELFTVHFESPEAAVTFITTVSNGEKFYKV